MELVPLHTRTDLIKSCISLLTTEWPEGKHQRLERLERWCCPNPPCSFVLVSNDDCRDVVNGHCRVVPVENCDQTLFIEQVVIDKQHRRQGNSRTLFQLLEQICSREGFKTLLLKTAHDLVPLYLKLGYQFTDVRPTIIGSKMLEYTTQVPLSAAYPGLEEYYRPYNGSVFNGPSSILLNSKMTTGVENEVIIDLPTWASDIDGLYFMRKDL